MTMTDAQDRYAHQQAMRRQAKAQARQERDAALRSEDDHLPSLFRRCAVRMEKAGHARDAELLWQLGQALGRGLVQFVDTMGPFHDP